jgi:fatty-acyl-CoA synthase
MRDVKPGEVGEIVHRSPHLMLEYFHDDERTKAAFEDGWFHSGNLATTDEDKYITSLTARKI